MAAIYDDMNIYRNNISQSVYLSINLFYLSGRSSNHPPITLIVHKRTDGEESQIL